MLSMILFYVIVSWNIIGRKAMPAPDSGTIGGMELEPEGVMPVTNFMVQQGLLPTGGLVEFTPTIGGGLNTLFLPAAAGPTAAASGVPPGAGATNALAAGAAGLSLIPMGEQPILGTLANRVNLASAFNNFLVIQNNPTAMQSLLSGLNGAISSIFNSVLRNIFGGDGATMG